MKPINALHSYWIQKQPIPNYAQIYGNGYSSTGDPDYEPRTVFDLDYKRRTGMSIRRFAPDGRLNTNSSDDIIQPEVVAWPYEKKLDGSEIEPGERLVRLYNYNYMRDGSFTSDSYGFLIGPNGDGVDYRMFPIYGKYNRLQIHVVTMGHSITLKLYRKTDYNGDAGMGNGNPATNPAFAQHGADIVISGREQFHLVDVEIEIPEGTFPVCVWGYSATVGNIVAGANNAGLYVRQPLVELCHNSCWVPSTLPSGYTACPNSRHMYGIGKYDTVGIKVGGTTLEAPNVGAVNSPCLPVLAGEKCSVNKFDFTSTTLANSNLYSLYTAPTFLHSQQDRRPCGDAAGASDGLVQPYPPFRSQGCDPHDHYQPIFDTNDATVKLLKNKTCYPAVPAVMAPVWRYGIHKTTIDQAIVGVTASNAAGNTLYELQSSSVFTVYLCIDTTPGATIESTDDPYTFPTAIPARYTVIHTFSSANFGSTPNNCTPELYTFTRNASGTKNVYAIWFKADINSFFYPGVRFFQPYKFNGDFKSIKLWGWKVPVASSYKCGYAFICDAPSEPLPFDVPYYDDSDLTWKVIPGGYDPAFVTADAPSSPYWRDYSTTGGTPNLASSTWSDQTVTISSFPATVYRTATGCGRFTLECGASKAHRLIRVSFTSFDPTSSSFASKEINHNEFRTNSPASLAFIDMMADANGRVVFYDFSRWGSSVAGGGIAANVQDLSDTLLNTGTAVGATAILQGNNRLGGTKVSLVAGTKYRIRVRGRGGHHFVGFGKEILGNYIFKASLGVNSVQSSYMSVANDDGTSKAVASAIRLLWDSTTINPQYYGKLIAYNWYMDGTGKALLPANRYMSKNWSIGTWSTANGGASWGVIPGTVSIENAQYNILDVEYTADETRDYYIVCSTLGGIQAVYGMVTVVP